MTIALSHSTLFDRLPKVRGRLTSNAPLAQYTWFNVGGPAEVLFRPADHDDLAEFLAATPADIPVTVMGVASNIIIRDGGIPGVVIRLGREFAGIAVDSDNHRITAGSAALDMNVAMSAAQQGIAGLEFLSGIPGSIGGGGVAVIEHEIAMQIGHGGAADTQATPADSVDQLPRLFTVGISKG